MLGSIYNYVFGKSLSFSARPYATNNPALSEAIQQLFHPRLTTVMQQLDALAPRFTMNGENIHILTLPLEFYSTLKTKIASAKSRVFLSSLYVGKTETELVQCLHDALAANDDLKVYVLTDALRGTREAPHAPSLASLLVPLVEKFGTHRVDIRMYHTPHLHGFKKSLAPKRVNELFGLQHMKLYGFDNEIMLSGANLSEDYFTDRQDRYYLFKDTMLTDYYFRIHSAIASLLYQVATVAKPHSHQNFRFTWPLRNALCEPDLNLHRFIADSSQILEPILKQLTLGSFETYEDVHDDAFDTVIYPVSQFTPLFPPNIDVSTEKPAILRILSFLDSAKVKWWFTAGYFNMLPQIQERILEGQALGVLITASQKANSFYKSSGVSYYIPEAYLLIAKKFLEEIKKRGKDSFIKLYEWQNGVVNTPGGWSYHAKGIWVSVPEENKPSITVIGSSNYTKRAYTLDLESNAVVITKNEGLKQRMKAEIDNLLTHAQELTLEDFKPKLQDKDKPEPRLDAQGDPIEIPDVYAVDADRRISYGVHLALKFFGGKL